MYQINHKRPPRFSSPRKSTPEPGSTEASLLKELQKLTSALGQVRSREGREVQAHQAALLEDAQGGDARVSSAQSDAATTAPPSREAGSARAAHLLFVRRVLFPRAARSKKKGRPISSPKTAVLHRSSELDTQYSTRRVRVTLGKSADFQPTKSSWLGIRSRE